LQRLTVDRTQAHNSLTHEEKALRNDLWAHARQLGDKLAPEPGMRSIRHLKQAVAYEHWHRLLFARFLAENDLLMHPEHGVALSLDEVKELALGQRRDWIELAAEYAQRMLLREVFRSDDPALRVPLSPEKRRDLEGKLNLLPREIFLADDSLGWVYQFWQRDAKEKVEAELQSGEKADADRIPAKTQLFTEDYMVLFLLENTLGAWWTAQRGETELPGYKWTYLRISENGTPAAGRYDGWPKSARELKVLDPCMGSGHFLTFALPILARMRAAEDGLPITDAIAAALRDNLFGLELDPRCSQIAAFNLALTAWKLAGQHFELPPLNLACSGLGINSKEEDWVRLAGSDGLAAEALRRLYSLFKDAPTLGSLIDPLRLKANVYAADTEHVLPLLEEALKNEASNEEARELAIAAQGVLAAFRILAGEFTLVPYLGRGKQCPLLAEFCAEFHAHAKPDLATCLVERSLRFCAVGGSIALVSPQNWLFLGGYQEFREELLNTAEWDFIARLGTKAFQTPMWDFNVMLHGFTRRSPVKSMGIATLDVARSRTPMEKALALTEQQIVVISQVAQLQNPDARIVFLDLGNQPLLSKYAAFGKGCTTGDSPHYHRYIWEFPSLPGESVPWLDSPVPGDLWSGRSLVLPNGLHDPSLLRELGLFVRGQAVWGKTGVAVNKSNKLEAFLSTGEVFDDNIGTLVPYDQELLPAILTFCQSKEYSKNLRVIDQALKVTAATLVKVPFDMERWRELASEVFPNGLPKPNSTDPTQWLFNGNPKGSENTLQVAVARLVGYRWPRQTGNSFPDCPAIGPDGLEAHAAADGIVCLSSVAGEENAGTRLRALLQSALGQDYNLPHLLAGKKAGTIEDWLRDEFFQEHCQIFHQRPFVWHIWDGLKDGFHGLVNYHKLDRRNLEKLIYSYLGDWLTRQGQEVQQGVEGADTRVAAAEHLQDELKRILEGQNPYDIFVRWKPLDKQSIGWEPDLNDGVRMNIRPWITEAKLYKATKPGILRVTPNIKYTKDRGKDSSRDLNEFPWIAKSADRINDVHLSLDEKRRARGLQ
jgi:hypothetical protein